MESVKSVLRQALEQSALAIDIVSGQNIKIILQNQNILENPVNTDDNLLETLFKSFLPKSYPNIQQGKTTEGLLNIVNFGDLKVVAIPLPVKTLKIFIPPHGNSLYEEWHQQQLRSQGQIFNNSNQPLPTAAQNTIPQAAQNAMPQAAQNTMPQAAQNTMPQAAQNAMPQAAQNTTPPAAQNHAIGNQPSIQTSDPNRDNQSPSDQNQLLNESGAINFNNMHKTAPAQNQVSKPNIAKDQNTMPKEQQAQANQSASNPLAMFAQSSPVEMIENNEDSIEQITNEPENESFNPASPSNIDISELDSASTSTPNLNNIQPPPESITYESSPSLNHGIAMPNNVDPSISHQPTFEGVPQHTQPQSNLSTSSSDKKIYFGATTPKDSVPGGEHKIDSILSKMIQLKASDLHLTIGQSVIYRIDGEIVRDKGQPISAEDMEAYLLEIMPARNSAEFLETHDTDFAYEVESLGRFRVNIFRNLQGVGAVLRHIASEVLSADQLNLPGAIRKMSRLRKGLVLVTGPTGSGKSTTLAAMIDMINSSRREHILTIEDPIEFVHKQKSCLINQREVKRHTTSFSRALKAALREDPDIVLIGELRDLETVAIAIETAETGHLVFGTLHTNTAISTVDRIVDQFPGEQQEQIRSMLAESLKGVVAQTLLKKSSGGRVAAHEILVVSRACSNLIREGKTHMIQNHMQTQKADGNITLNDSLIQLVKDGSVNVEEALNKAVDKDAFISSARNNGIDMSFMNENKAV